MAARDRDGDDETPPVQLEDADSPTAQLARRLRGSATAGEVSGMTTDELMALLRD